MPLSNRNTHTRAEIARLSELESRFRVSRQEGESRLRECGALLRTIKADATYKSVDRSFARYVSLRFGITPRYANDLIWHADLCDQLSAHGLPLPLERQSRELHRLRENSNRVVVTWTVAHQRGFVGNELKRFAVAINAEAVSTEEAANAVADSLVAPSRVVRDPDLIAFNRVVRDLIENLRDAQDMDDVYNVFERLAQERPRVRLLSEAA